MLYPRSNLRKKYRSQKLITQLLLVLVGLIAVGFICALIVFAWFARDLPAPGKLSQNTGAASTVFYDRDGKVIYEMYKEKNRIPVAYADISDWLKKGTVAIEDKTFFTHKGVSELGIIRSVVNLFLKGRMEGGSTITQQLIKMVLLDSGRNLPRKIKEAILAFEVERKYSKEQILEMYLNEAPYGGNYYGINTAASNYFGKQPKDLDLVESAILAGLPQNPPYYSPFIGTKNAWKGRTMDVLRRMREDGYITKDQEKQALSKLNSITFSSAKTAISAPHFVFYIKDLIQKEYGIDIASQGVKVKTTLSLDVQKSAEKIVKDEITNLKKYSVTNGAVVILDSQTGEVLAMVGSYDYNDDKYGKFNAALGLRQPGSTIKPITYATAFEKGYTPATLLMDVKTTFPDQGEKDYIPENYDEKFHGPTQVRFALGNSINVVAVKMLAMVGVRDFLQKAYDMGLDTFAPTDANMKRFGLAITLGGGESRLIDMTSAFSIFANGGTKNEVSSILEITDFKNKSIYKKTSTKKKTVLSKEIAFLISHILSDNNARLDAFGPTSYLNVPGKTVAVKTGTTNDKRDNWTIGYTKSVTVGVWVGNNDNSPMDPKIASGITGASPIWYNIMREILKKYSDGIIDKPDNVKAVQIDSFLGGLPKDGVPTRSEYFISGTEPKEVSPFYKKLKISKSNGKIANEVEVKSGNYDEKDFYLITENDPVSTDGKNRWQEAIDAWAREQKDDKYHYPTETSDNSSENVVVSIKNPTDKQKLTSKDVEIKAKITSLSAIKNIKIYLNDKEVKSINENKSEIVEPMNLNEEVYELKITATNDKDKTGEAKIKFGINKDVN